MTHEEMSNFTNDELENFRHLELSLEKTELLKTVLSNRKDIPSDVKDKLQKLCQDFIQSCEDYDIDIPPETKELKNKKTLSVTEICTIITAITAVISMAIQLYSTLHSQPVNNTYINQTTTIINEQTINNITIIYNQIIQ